MLDLLYNIACCVSDFLLVWICILLALLKHNKHNPGFQVCHILFCSHPLQPLPQNEMLSSTMYIQHTREIVFPSVAWQEHLATRGNLDILYRFFSIVQKCLFLKHLSRILYTILLQRTIFEC